MHDVISTGLEERWQSSQHAKIQEYFFEREPDAYIAYAKQVPASLQLHVGETDGLAERIGENIYFAIERAQGSSDLQYRDGCSAILVERLR